MKTIVKFLASTSTFLVAMFLSMQCNSEEISFSNNTREVSNWLTQASNNLDVDYNELLAKKELRCIKLNNYWCIKDSGWNGALGSDADRHAAFKTGEYAARAAARNFRTAYTKHNRKTAFQIMSTYAPPTDCIGSNAARKADGTCIHGKNQTLAYATQISRPINGDPHADLLLFDATTGKATPALAIFMRSIALFEMGIGVKRELVDRGICLEDESCTSPDAPTTLRTPMCPASSTAMVAKGALREPFAKRYCSHMSDEKCESRWNNFLLLFIHAQMDPRVSRITVASFLIATANAETGIGDFSPATRERRGPVNKNRAYWNADPQTGEAYFGRGWIQLTWKDKYELAAKSLKLDLLKTPDLALTPDVAYEILVRSLLDGWLENYRSTPSGSAGHTPIKLRDFISDNSVDYASARAVINANCKGSCSTKTRIKIDGKGYIPLPDHIDAARAVESDAIYIEAALCKAAMV